MLKDKSSANVFCKFVEDSMCLHQKLFTDEAAFIMDSILKLHNMCTWVQ